MTMRERGTATGSSRARSWVVGTAMAAVVIGTGWYVGTRVGAPAPQDEADADARIQVYRDIGGRVLSVEPDEGVVRVHHERIEGLMDAMVMDLKVADSVDLARVQPGDRIRFDLALVDDTYEVITIRPQEGTRSQPTDGDPRYATPADPLEPGDRIPDLELYDARGRSFRLGDLEHRRMLVTFFYVRCPLKQFCPAQSARLRKLQDELEQQGSDVHLVSLSLDSDHDDAEVLAEYAQRFGADPERWTLAGGRDPEAVRRFAHRAGAGAQRREEGIQIDHALIGLRVDDHRIVDRVYGLGALARMARGI